MSYFHQFTELFLTSCMVFYTRKYKPCTCLLSPKRTNRRNFKRWDEGAKCNSEDHRIIQESLEVSSPNFCSKQGQLRSDKVTQGFVRHILKTCMDGRWTTSLGSLLHCSTVLRVRKLFLTAEPKPHFSSCHCLLSFYHVLLWKAWLQLFSKLL